MEVGATGPDKLRKGTVRGAYGQVAGLLVSGGTLAYVVRTPGVGELAGLFPVATALLRGGGVFVTATATPTAGVPREELDLVRCWFAVHAPLVSKLDAARRVNSSLSGVKAVLVNGEPYRCRSLKSLVRVAAAVVDAVAGNGSAVLTVKGEAPGLSSAVSALVRELSVLVPPVEAFVLDPAGVDGPESAVERYLLLRGLQRSGEVRTATPQVQPGARTGPAVGGNDGQVALRRRKR